jgi:hypothetical protein
MRRRSTGQSLVEMAFVAPILIVILFGIIDMGWLIFAYATVSQGARAGAEAAAQLPPYPSWLAYGDPGGNPGDGFTNINQDACVKTIVDAVRQDSVLFRGAAEGGLNGGRDIGATAGGSLDYINITYPNGSESRNLVDRGPVQIEVSYPVQPLTPLFNLLRIGNADENGDRSLMLTITVRRSIENLGINPGSPTGVACASDMPNWRAINGIGN